MGLEGMDGAGLPPGTGGGALAADEGPVVLLLIPAPGEGGPALPILNKKDKNFILVTK